MPVVSWEGSAVSPETYIICFNHPISLMLNTSMLSFSSSGSSKPVTKERSRSLPSRFPSVNPGSLSFGRTGSLNFSLKKFIVVVQCKCCCCVDQQDSRTQKRLHACPLKEKVATETELKWGRSRQTSVVYIR
jgi:hypothetical protein